MWELMQPDLGKPLASSWKGVRLYNTDREPATKRATLGSALRSQALEPKRFKLITSLLLGHESGFSSNNKVIINCFVAL